MQNIQKINYKISELDSMKKYPKKLYYKGNIDLLKRKKVSIVGSRKPNSYSKAYTYTLAQKLSSRGFCIVSGGAIGVDAIAHSAAGVENTILVSPCGLNHKYPSINKKLINQIEEKGLLVSSYEPEFKATAYSFVQRNEIVVALGDILIVTYADINSGSLRSVEFALKMKKEVYVLPHRINESIGTNLLLKENKVKAIYDIDEFLGLFNSFKKEDEFLQYCKNHPSLEEAIFLFGNRVFEYELNGFIFIKEGKIYLN
ncbi:DNA-processing protein DprA [Malaciobacter mytili]|uniref:DNA-processing protein DprA n=1 Tax=Malaciobacter mytili TaxID=603050 RepID=UPI003A8BFB09